MFLGAILKPVLDELEVNDSTVDSAIGLADAGALAGFVQNGFEAVGGLGEGANFASIQPTPAPALEAAPTMQANASAPLVGADMNMNMTMGA